MRNNKKQRESKGEIVNNPSRGSSSLDRFRSVPNALYQISVPSSKLGLMTIIPSVIDEVKNDRDMLQAISYAFSTARAQGYTYEEWIGSDKRSFLKKLVTANLNHVEQLSGMLTQVGVDQKEDNSASDQGKLSGVKSIWEGII